MRTKSWRQGYSFYDNSEDAASARKPVAIYSQEGNASYKQQFVTTLRATHNIPRIGFVVTMTAQAIWQQSNWNTFGNDSIPGLFSIGRCVCKYVSQGEIYHYPASKGCRIWIYVE